MLTVAKLARIAGVSPDTIRYYDRKGMLGLTERTAAGYRVYSPAVAGRLGFIRKAGFACGRSPNFWRSKTGGFVPAGGPLLCWRAA